MEKLMFEVKNNKAHVKVFAMPGGYIIESFEKFRKPQVIRSTYKNSQYCSENTEWNAGIVRLHGYYERAGFITPVESMQ